MAKIDRVEDLPEWFDLEKYNGCESFKYAEWFSELFRRKNLFDAYQSFASDPGFDRDIIIALTSNILCSIRQTPIDHSIHILVKDVLPPVRDVRVFDLRMQAYRDEIAEREGRCEPERMVRWAAIGDPEYPLKSAIKVSNIPIDIDFYTPNSLPTAVIQVDLNAHDGLLKEAFFAWLKEARASQKSDTTKRQKPSYERWARYGLLPYLDLLIWEMETGNSIPDRVMSAAISRYDAGETNLRKTIAPLASYLMRDLSGVKAAALAKATGDTENFED